MARKMFRCQNLINTFLNVCLEPFDGWVGRTVALIQSFIKQLYFRVEPRVGIEMTKLSFTVATKLMTILNIEA